MSQTKTVAMALFLAVPLAFAPARADETRKRPQRKARGTTITAAQLDSERISPKTRSSFEKFWDGMSQRERKNLESQLAALEVRATKGESVQKEANELLATQPQLKTLSDELGGATWFATGGGSQEVSCIGIGWIGKNGKLRCIGRLAL
jgi:hypothetical protein